MGIESKCDLSIAAVCRALAIESHEPVSLLSRHLELRAPLTGIITKHLRRNETETPTYNLHNPDKPPLHRQKAISFDLDLAESLYPLLETQMWPKSLAPRP